MGWADLAIAGHKDRRAFKGGGFKFLHGFEKKPRKVIVAVTVPVIAPGGLAAVDIAVADVEPVRWHKAIAFEPPSFAAVGVTFLTSAIISSGTVRLLFQNHGGGPSVEHVADWDLYHFSRTGTS